MIHVCKSMVSAGAVALLVMAGGSAQALTWDMDLAFLPSFDAFNGSLDYDSSAQTLSSADFILADLGFAPIFASWTETDVSSLSENPGGGLTQVVFTNSASEVLDLSFAAPLTNLGGTIDVTLVFNMGPNYAGTLFTKISAPVTPPSGIPLPAGLPLMLGAVSLFALLRARRAA